MRRRRLLAEIIKLLFCFKTPRIIVKNVYIVLSFDEKKLYAVTTERMLAYDFEIFIIMVFAF